MDGVRVQKLPEECCEDLSSKTKRKKEMETVKHTMKKGGRRSKERGERQEG